MCMAATLKYHMTKSLTRCWSRRRHRSGAYAAELQRQDQMHPLACPHCRLRCLSFWSKASLGPATKRPCESCGRLVSVPWLPSLAVGLLSGVITIIVGVEAIALLGPLPSGWFALVGVLGMLAINAPLLWLYYRFVPLVARAA